MRAAFATAAFGQQDVAFTSKCRELLLDRSHALANLSHPTLELGVVDRTELVGHTRTLPALMARAPVMKPCEQSQVIDDFQAAARKEGHAECRDADGKTG